MVAQCNLLAGDSIEPTEDAFGIPARGCTVEDLRKKIERNPKTHRWSDLHGGAKSALKRVLRRPNDFTSNLNPKGHSGWTFPDVVLLPTVMGSQHVQSAIEEMASLGQHVVRMTAEEQTFLDYTSSNPHNNPNFTSIIRNSMRNKRDLALGYENRIVHHMWVNRPELQADLLAVKVPPAKEATRDDYMSLLQNSEVWQSLFKLFKVSHFPDGFRLRVGKRRPGDDEARSDVALSQTVNPVEEPVPHHPNELPRDGMSTDAEHLEGSAEEPGQFIASDTTMDGQASVQSAPPQKRGRREIESLNGPHESATARTEVNLVGGTYEDAARLDDEDQEPSQSPDQGQNPDPDGEYIPDQRPSQRRRLDSDDEAPTGKSLPPRLGGDRALSHSLERLNKMQGMLRRPESSKLTQVCQLIMKAKQLDLLEPLLETLYEKGEARLDKLQRARWAEYEEDTSAEGSTRDEGVGSESHPEGMEETTETDELVHLQRPVNIPAEWEQTPEHGAETGMGRGEGGDVNESEWDTRHTDIGGVQSLEGMHTSALDATGSQEHPLLEPNGGEAYAAGDNSGS